MSVGLLFHYFQSKEELFVELVKLGIEGPMQTMQPTQMEPLAFFEALTAEQILKLYQSRSVRREYVCSDESGLLQRRCAGPRNRNDAGV